jgi:hypothetical protein
MGSGGAVSVRGVPPGGLAEYLYVVLTLDISDVRRKLFHGANDGAVALGAGEIHCLVQTDSVGKVPIHAASEVLGKQKVAGISGCKIEAMHTCVGGPANNGTSHRIVLLFYFVWFLI